MNTNETIMLSKTSGVNDVKEYILNFFDHDTVHDLALELLSLQEKTEVVKQKHTYKEVYELYFKEYRDELIQNAKSPSCLQALQGVNNKYIFKKELPYQSFADRYVEDLSVYDVKKLKKEIKNNSKNNHGEPLTCVRLRKIYLNIDKVFCFAADLGYVSVEFCKEIKIHNVGGRPSKNKQLVRNYLDEQEFGTFSETYDCIAYEYFKGNKEIRISSLHEMPVDAAPIATFRSLLYKAIYSCYFWTGARLNEARGLLWSDLIDPTDDFPLYRLKFEHQYKEKGASLLGLEVYTAKPKTDDSVRVVTLNVNFVKDLNELRLYLISRDMYDANQYIFFDFYCETPKPIPESNITRVFHRIMDESNIEKNSMRLNGVDRNITLHGMRHAAASCLLERGMPQRDVARFLGHSNENMVTYIYNHFIDPEHLETNRKDDASQFFTY